MTDRELLEQIGDRLEKFYKEFSAFRKNTEINLLQLSNELRADNKLINAKLDNLNSRLELLSANRLGSVCYFHWQQR
ncbi:MAG: hypothetical protein L0220_03365 [Acidobacteria bacterium]|nr:hypothetical protein [Acidobacteriota bacterium]